MQSCSSSLAELSLISKFSWLLTRPYPTWLTYSDRNSYFLSISQPVLDAIQSNQDQSSSSQLDWIMHYFKFNKPFNLTLRAIISLKNNSLEITSHEIFLPSSVSTQLLSTSTSIEAEISNGKFSCVFILGGGCGQIFVSETDLSDLSVPIFISGWTNLRTRWWKASQKAASGKDWTETPSSSFYNPWNWPFSCYPCLFVWAPLQVSPEVVWIRKHKGIQHTGWFIMIDTKVWARIQARS